jgi:hypothetical protein
MIGPDRTGQRLGIVRFGGHIEGVESLYETLEREVQEEASIKVSTINSPKTYYKPNWHENYYSEVNIDGLISPKPLIICGNPPSTAVFLSYAEEEPKPASEAHGIIFLRKQDIIDICTSKMDLNKFLRNGGKLLQQKSLDYSMEMYAGVHLQFFYNLLKDNSEIGLKFLEGAL